MRINEQRLESGGGRRGAVAVAVAVALAAGALLGVAAFAAATAGRVPSNVIAIAGGEFGPDNETAVIGVVRSPNRRCLRNRRIVVTLKEDASTIPSMSPGAATTAAGRRAGRRGCSVPP